MNRKIVLHFPRPARELHAHNKGKWRGKATAIKARRELVAMLTQSEMKWTGFRGGWQLARIHYRFLVPDNRKRDLANLIQQEKPTVDGIVDAGLILGDHWQVLEMGSCSAEIDRKAPGTVITIEELES